MRASGPTTGADPLRASTARRREAGGRPIPTAQPVTRSSASRTMRPLIFEVPSARSVKVIGTSARRSPSRRATYVDSIWKA